MIGLAAACAVAARGRTTCVIERLPGPGQEASTYNSGVVHAGIYYARDSPEGRPLCRGTRAAVRLLRGARRAVRALRQADRPPPGGTRSGALEALATRGHANGVTDLDVVDCGFVRRREPHVEAAAATWSPSTGILEAEAYVRALARVAAARDVALLPGAGAGVARPDGLAISRRHPGRAEAARPAPPLLRAVEPQARGGRGGDAALRANSSPVLTPT